VRLLLLLLLAAGASACRRPYEVREGLSYDASIGYPGTFDVYEPEGEHDMTMPPELVMGDFDDILAKVMGHAAPWSDAGLRDISTVTFARPDVSLLTVHGAGDCHDDCWRVPEAREAIHRFLDRELAHDGDGFLQRRRATRDRR
jgi:hypothetical protein